MTDSDKCQECYGTGCNYCYYTGKHQCKSCEGDITE